jgi:hypothetical protein
MGGRDWKYVREERDALGIKLHREVVLWSYQEGVRERVLIHTNAFNASINERFEPEVCLECT